MLGPDVDIFFLFRCDKVHLHVGLFAVLGEHGGNDVGHDVQFGFIRSGDIDEDVGRVQSDLTVVRVDDGGHG